MNEKALPHWGLSPQKPTNPYLPHYFLFILRDCFIAVIRLFGRTNCTQMLTCLPWHKHQADSTGTFLLNEDDRIDGRVFRQWTIKFRTVKCMLTVVIPVNNQLDALFSMYLFISLLYMLRATQCSSSGESNCINTSSGMISLCR